MPGILIDCLRKYQRLSQTPLESTRAPVHFLMLGGAGQAVPTIDAYKRTDAPQGLGLGGRLYSILIGSVIAYRWERELFGRIKIEAETWDWECMI